jgi:two-component system OmpR family response regulator
MENTASTPEKARILVAEDDPNLGIILTEYLEAKGYLPTLAKNGVEGWKAFSNNDFDICVLDVMMP